MEFDSKREHKEFQKKVEYYLLQPDSRDSENFLFRAFNLWITFFFQDYKERWGKNNFTKAEEEDIRQEIIITFFNVLKKQRRFKYAQARVYLLRIFHSKCIDAIRNKNRQFLRLEDEAETEFAIIPDEDEAVFTQLEVMQLITPYWQKALDQSSESTRIIINLLYEKTPYKKICRQLGEPDCSANAFKQKIYRAKKTFRQTLLAVLQAALSQEKMNAVELELIEMICKKIEKNIS